MKKKNLNQNQNFSSFRPILDFELSGKRSRAKPKIFQLELWLEPARLGLITSTYVCPQFVNQYIKADSHLF